MIGYDNAFLASYRIDSLTSVYAAFEAFIQRLEPSNEELKMIVFWDNEEVGSHTAQGASSPFFQQTLERILLNLGANLEQVYSITNRSHCISIDLAHGLHPNYSDKHDANHQPILGNGVVLKTNAQQRYATNANSSIAFQQIATIKNIPIQYFSSRNDMPCGSTIGPLQACRTGISTVDIGCAQLSMHSSRELMACKDYIELCELLVTYIT